MDERFELLVVGGTAGGIAAALRAARNGLDVALLVRSRNLGGFFPSLGAIETLYRGNRTPILTELEDRIDRHYRETYGEDSTQYKTWATRTPMKTFEPHVLEGVLEEIVAEEASLTTRRGYELISVDRVDGELGALRVETDEGRTERRFGADVFIDATYEGDVAALAGVPYRVGRESRAEFDEPHAGQVFTRWVDGEFPREAAEGTLDLIPTATTFGYMSGSTGRGDENIQAYSYRLCLCSDPENRRLPEKPENYDRSRYLGIVESPEETAEKRYPIHHRYLRRTLPEQIRDDHIFHGHELPNDKRSFNGGNFPGRATEYPDGNAETRAEIEKCHLDHALGFVYFLQNDPAVPEEIREEAREWGLATDEFTESENRPPQMYVREARRIQGEYTLTENDFRIESGIERAPIHENAVAFSAFTLDSLACTTERRWGSLADGQLHQAEVTRPGQVPYGTMVPMGVSNLLVPVAASATHVAWGTVRQTPDLIHLGEVAGHATVTAKDTGKTPATLEIDQLQRRLVEADVMVSFFNELDGSTEEKWVPAVQYMGTKGFFDSYDGLPEEPLVKTVAREWSQGARAILNGSVNPNERARAVERATRTGGDPVSAREFAEMLVAAVGVLDTNTAAPAEVVERCGYQPSRKLTRAEGCRIVYSLVETGD